VVRVGVASTPVMTGPGLLSRVCTLQGHEDIVWCVAWRPHTMPPQFASCGQDRFVRIWGLQSGIDPEVEGGWVLLGDIDASERHSRTLRSITWSHDGKLAAVSSFDASTSLWQEARARDDFDHSGDGMVHRAGLTFECVGTVTGHENEVKSAGFSPSGEYFATCSRDKSVWIFETEQNFEYECVAVLQSHTQDVKFLKWHPSQDVLFSCSYDDTIKVWGPDGDDWSCKETLSAHESTVWCLSWDHLGARFATCSDDRTLRIWMPVEEQASKPSATSEAKRSPSVSLATFVSPLFRGALMGGSESDSSVPVNSEMRAPADSSCPWKCVSVIENQHPRPIYSCDWLKFEMTPGGALIASGGGDNHIRVFQQCSHGESWSCVADVDDAHDGDVNCVAWCPERLADGGCSAGAVLLASAGDDGEVILWRFRV